MKLKEIRTINGKIKLLTGLAIGGGNEKIEIGGNDNPIIRNPLTNEPYIPGSTLKGKMRSLTEWNLGKVEANKNIHTCSEKTCIICKIFGRGAEEAKKSEAGPTRITLRDAYLTKESKDKLNDLKRKKGTDSETKYENTINRYTGEARPRNLERVPAGIEFEFNISIKVFDKDENLLDTIYKAMKLLEADGIGGGVSRGNGQIKFIDLKEDGKEIKL